ncbi:structure-specific endonuclease subunit slx1-like [Daphnia pulex]|uniref:structure-specific endonuclease subunit slx1-like n=1 Tax=Daphnia pulex TaxID=6669 RepID=UPI001EDF8736|nr:structure-specific endonuclease subunit slx1-like [Daphnia pulex]
MSSTVIENFYGVYLLFCENPKYLGRTYIGYTVNPNRRIQQHNKGVRSGGAYKTSNKGPWEMCLIVHGFPNDISGLRFEWAWQHPEKSRRLRKLIERKRAKENSFQHKIRILSHMLRIGPWNRLALTIQWLVPKYRVEFETSLLPPPHMPIEEGRVISKKVPSPSNEKVSTKSSSSSAKCDICHQIMDNDDVLNCINNDCTLKTHILCLASHFLKSEPDHMLPLEGSCPSCHSELLWADLIRKFKGCYQNQNLALDETILT